MINDLRLTVWDQFGAAIDSLEKAMNECPDKVWGDRIDWHEFWYLASHTLFWLDYYLTDSPDTYQPPEPFDLCEIDPEGPCRSASTPRRSCCITWSSAATNAAK